MAMERSKAKAGDKRLTITD